MIVSILVFSLALLVIVLMSILLGNQIEEKSAPSYVIGLAVVSSLYIGSFSIDIIQTHNEIQDLNDSLSNIEYLYHDAIESSKVITTPHLIIPDTIIVRYNSEIDTSYMYRIDSL